ncbi:sialidase family protein [Vibrio sp. YYF0003]|uniref:sialidase family protein n=1 Tax=Vibrio sp. YYF0003 TaxID=3116646 RepID=UPI002ECE7787|nr:exo-alpha-sialidase [Vibrio sp. YYF0003]
MNQEAITVERDGKVVPVEHREQYYNAMLPSDYPQNHASNLLVLPNGDLLCTWFAGTQEGVSDISILCSRLRKDSNEWEPAVKLSNDPERSEQNPVLFLDPDNTLWLLWTAQLAGNQDTAIVRYRKSFDLGETWQDIDVLIDKPGTFIRQPIVVLPNGNWLLPIFNCTIKPGEKWVGNYDTSSVKISEDKGQTWRDVDVPESLGCVHMSVAFLKNGSLIAVYRSRWADSIYQSYSHDNGETWSAPVPTELPNNNSSIQLTALNNGDLAMVFNNMSAEGATDRRSSLYDEIEDDSDAKEPEIIDGKSAFWGAPRAPMSLAISKDDGASWQIVANLDEGDGFCMTNNSQEKLNREFSYPTITQSSDGAIHIAYTYFRQAIKYVRINHL